MSNDILRKKTSLNGTVEVKPINKSIAKEICIKNHYSHKWNSAFGKINLGIFRENSDQCLGVAVFGNIMNPQSYKSISDDLQQDEIVELNRLWVDDKLKRNIETVFLSLCFKYIKKNHPEIKLIQSFADGRIGCGTVYKAANFKYYGYHKTKFFERLDIPDIVYHRALTVDTRRLSTLALTNLLMARDKLRLFIVKTYRYIYILDKRISNSIKLKEQAYPKYEKGKIYIDGFIQPVTTLCKAYLAFKIADKQEYMNEVYKYILKNYGELSLKEIYDYAMSDHMKLFLEQESYQSKLIKGFNELFTKYINQY